MVGIGDFAGVLVIRKPCREGLRGDVSGMRIVVMKEEKEGLAVVGIEPRQCALRHLATTPLRHAERVQILFEAVVVGIKTLVKPELGIQDKGTDHGSGGHAVLAQ